MIDRTKDVLAIAGVFAFLVPEYLEDDAVVGKVVGVTIHAGEVRRLTKLITELRDATHETRTVEQDAPIVDLLKERKLIDAIRLRREQTGQHLKAAKDYVEALGVKHGLRTYYDDGTWRTGYYWVGEEPVSI